MSIGDRPAFPIVDPDGVIAAGGLTKRELFAAMAMQGFCSNSVMTETGHADMARMAVEQADALLAELAKEAA